MKLVSGILGFTLTGVVALASANAADMAPPAGPGGYKDAPWVATWSGFYAGINLGGGWSEFSDKFASTGTGFSGLSPKGGFGGGQIGYNWQGIWHPHLVLGVEADIQGAGGGIQGKAIDALGHHFSSSLDTFGTVRGRLGYAFGPSLVYATGGFAYGQINNEADGLVAFKNTNTATGYVVGGGYEYKFSPGWSAKVEYQFINLGRNDPAFLGISACAAGGVKCEDDAIHSVRGGINYHFGRVYEPLK
jgi:outer membrane immunogenic protein